MVMAISPSNVKIINKKRNKYNGSVPMPVILNKDQIHLYGSKETLMRCLIVLVTLNADNSIDWIITKISVVLY